MRRLSRGIGRFFAGLGALEEAYLWLPVLISLAPFGFAMMVLLDMKRRAVRCGVAALYAGAFAATYLSVFNDAIAELGEWQAGLTAIVVGTFALAAMAVAIVNVTWTIPTAYRFCRKRWRRRGIAQAIS